MLENVLLCNSYSQRLFSTDGVEFAKDLLKNDYITKKTKMKNLVGFI